MTDNKELPRIIYYYQTFCELNKILQKPCYVTHIHLASIHFGLDDNNKPYIHLNNYEPYNSKFDSVWTELEKATELGITVILMVGGAGSAFYDLFSNYKTYYPLLKELIQEKRNIIKGIDLDIEEEVDIEDVKMLINNINKDFGNEFIITMAPIQSSLEHDVPGMGDFIYKDLYKSEEGKLISYFNTQFYFDYSKTGYDQIVKNGYPAEKIVMGMITNQNIDNDYLELQKTFQEYHPNFGGVFIWEYFNAPDDWLDTIKKIFLERILENPDCSIL